MRKSQQLLQKGKRIFKALSLEWRTSSFVAAVEATLACSGRVPPSTPTHVAVALAAAQGAQPIRGAVDLMWAEPVWRFYWSYKD